jgi:RNA polymerase primary sigma factor
MKRTTRKTRPSAKARARSEAGLTSRHGTEEQLQRTADLPAEAVFEGHTPVTEHAEWEDTTSADDALGLYLQQMGAIPMLTGKQEIKLTTRLDVLRSRYRKAAFWNWSLIERAIDLFERIRAGHANLERSVDVMPSLKLTADTIAKRLPGHLRRLHQLLDDARRHFRYVFQARTEAGRSRIRRADWARLREAVQLVEELSPRVELVNEWVADLQLQARHLHDLNEQLRHMPHHGARYADALEAVRSLEHQLLALPEDLDRLLVLLARRQARFQQTRRELAQANLRLVVSIAKKYRGRGLPFGDLIQEGNSGLMRAVDKFDYRLGWKFGTYATWWIRQGITRALADSGRMVRVPCHQVATLSAIDRARGELTLQFGREPVDEEICRHLKISHDDLRALTVVGRAPVSVDEAFSGDDEQTWVNFLNDESAANPGEDADRSLLRERIGEVLRSLAPRDREVIELRYGLRDGHSHTLDEVAQVLGVTRERIRQIEMRGLLKLRQPDRSDRLAEFADVA